MKKNVDFNKSISDDWKTPSILYDEFMKLGYLDPCPYKSTINGLNIDYYFENLFINPPYSDISKWVDYALRQFLDNGCNVTLLIPSRTDTKYFHKLLEYKPTLFFIKGRLHFNDSKSAAPFPSVIVDLVHESFFNHNYYSISLEEYIETLI